MNKNLISFHAGFTTIEIVVVLGILATVSTIVLTSFLLQPEKNDLASTVQEVTNALRLAQNKTLSSEGNSQYGVYFDTSVSPNKYVIFKGATYATRDAAADQIFTLPSSIVFYRINLTDGGTQVVFNKLTGLTTQSGSVPLAIKPSAQQLVGAWNLDESLGSASAVDSSGNNNNGTPTGTTADVSVPVVNFKDAYSRKFNGTSDFIDLGQPNFPAQADRMSFSAWVKTSSISSNPQSIFMRGNNSGRYYFYIGGGAQGPAGALTCGTLNPANAQYSYAYDNAVTLSISTWTHVACTIDTSESGNNRIRLYKNGAEITNKGILWNGVGPIGSTGINTYISKSFTGVFGPGQGFFNGNIANLKFYNRSLTLADVQADMVPDASYVSSVGLVSYVPRAILPSNSPSQGLLGGWSFDETSGTSNAIDYSGYGNNAVPNGTTADTSVPPVNFTDPYTRRLNGTGDYLNLGVAAQLPLSPTALTISTWVKPTALGTTDRFILMKGDTSGRYYMYLQGSAGPPGNLACGSRNPNNGQYSYAYANTSTATVGTWVYLTCVIDATLTGSSRIKIYKNGVEITNKTFVWTGGIGANATPNYIGTSNGASPFFAGNIDELRIYNRALSLSEIQSIMNSSPVNGDAWDSTRMKDSRHVNFDYNRTIANCPASIDETMNLYFDGSATPQQTLSVCGNLVGGLFNWSGTVNVGGVDQIVSIKTNYFNDAGYANKNQFSVHRDRRYNSKSLRVTLSGDATGDLINYSADGGAIFYLSTYVSNFFWQ